MCVHVHATLRAQPLVRQLVDDCIAHPETVAVDAVLAPLLCLWTRCTRTRGDPLPILKTLDHLLGHQVYAHVADATYAPRTHAPRASRARTARLLSLLAHVDAGLQSRHVPQLQVCIRM